MSNGLKSWLNNVIDGTDGMCSWPVEYIEDELKIMKGCIEDEEDKKIKNSIIKIEIEFSTLYNWLKTNKVDLIVFPDMPM